ncbi:MAG: Nif3-like dinuclear metal center hexameric protein [Microscillaceae bacterium]
MIQAPGQVFFLLVHFLLSDKEKQIVYKVCILAFLTMTTLAHLSQALQKLAPLAYQEDYDNSGLLVGSPALEVKGVLIALDALEPVLEEARQKNCNVVLSHHPIIFKGLNKLTGQHYTERVVIEALKNDIALYALHTNLDNVRQGGVNSKIAEKLALQALRPLQLRPRTLSKLTTFVPEAHTEAVLQALGQAGAGQIGEYKDCSFRVKGQGRFTPSENANPFLGQAHQPEEVNEDRVEVIFPAILEKTIIQALRQAHPYEEVAYYLHRLENDNPEVGSGAIGVLPQALEEADFLAYLKEKMGLAVIRHTAFRGKRIEKVAVCGGAGSFLTQLAIAQGAQAFVSADFRYHEFFEADGQLMIADIGHYESERFTSELLQEYLQKSFPGLPVLCTTHTTNPIRYYS